MLISNKIKNILNQVKATHSVILPIVVKPDSGATSHFIRSIDKHCLQNICPNDGPTVVLPNGSHLKANAIGDLPIPELSVHGKKAHIIPGLKTASLLSIGKLCDDGCEVRLHDTNISVHKNNSIIF